MHSSIQDTSIAIDTYIIRRECPQYMLEQKLRKSRNHHDMQKIKYLTLLNCTSVYQTKIKR